MIAYFRLPLYFLFGLLLGAFSMSAFAVSFSASGGGSPLVSRSSSGSISSVNLPASAASTPAGIQASAMDGLLSLTQSGNWQVLDKDGRSISVPGTQKVSIPSPVLSRAAGTLAFFAKSSAQAAVVSYLVQQGIKLVEDEWKKDVETKPEGDLVITVGGFTGSDAPTRFCKSFGHPVYSATLYKSGDRYLVDCYLSDGKNFSEKQTFATTVMYRCPDGTVLSSPRCPVTLKEVPASESDLQDALEKRTKTINDALKDYYDSISAHSPDGLRDIAKDPATKYETTSTPTSGRPETTTSTSSTGSVTTTTNTTTYNITSQGNTYNNNTVVVTSTTITNVTADGVTTTTTTTTDAPAIEKEKNQTDCEKNPNAMACSEFGSVSDSDLQKKNLEGSITPISIGNSGQCPPPIVASVRGFSLSFSFDPFCRFADFIRAGILAMAWLSAGFILIGVIRE